MKITKHNLYDWWSKDETVRYRGELYRVGKMSYGDYFLEPRWFTGKETDQHCTKTIWFYLKDASKGVYGLESNKQLQ